MKINPVKGTLQSLQNGDGIQTINDRCYGVCAAYSGTYDTFNMDPQCVASCDALIESERIDRFGVGRCDHQTPLRPVIFNIEQRYFPQLVKQSMPPEQALQMCIKKCGSTNTPEECIENCNLDYGCLEQEVLETYTPTTKPTIIEHYTENYQDSGTKSSILFYIAVMVALSFLFGVLYMSFSKKTI